MSKTKKAGAVDASTEEKIKNAARIVFQKKGFAATRTRDIAEEAGINLALLNYYYRSKEKLFEIILLETLSAFFQSMVSVLNDETTTFDKKIELLVEKYINKFINEPDIPVFILNEVRNRPEALFEKVPVNQILNNSVFVQQFQKKVSQSYVKDLNILHFLLNLLGLVAFPFLAKPFISFVGGLTELQFNQLIQERKKMIPIWIEAMMTIDS